MDLAATIGKTAEPILSGRGLGKSYGALPVLHEVDFDVFPGEVLGVLGPNGAGKTTLFNLVSGDARLDAGVLTFAGARLQSEAPHKRCRRGIGRTYQIPKPYGAMSAFENLLVASMFGAQRTTRDAYEHCNAILEDCSLADKANRPAGKLTLLDRKRLRARSRAGEQPEGAAAR